MIPTFNDQPLEEAPTHTSWAYENGGTHNERLDPLGDAVLQRAGRAAVSAFSRRTRRDPP